MKIIIKGIIFYTTMLLAMIYIMAIDSLSFFATIGGFAILFALFLLCANKISQKDFEKILFSKYFKED